MPDTPMPRSLVRKGLTRVAHELPAGAEVAVPVDLVRVLWGEELLARFGGHDDTQGERDGDD